MSEVVIIHLDFKSVELWQDHLYQKCILCIRVLLQALSMIIRGGDRQRRNPTFSKQLCGESGERADVDVSWPTVPHVTRIASLIR
jgi:hypothetical protein